MTRAKKSPGGKPEIASLEPVEGRAWGGFLRAHHRIVKQLDAELRAGHGLALSEYEVLLLLAWSAEGRMQMSALTKQVLLTPSGLTRTVDRLERDGLVRREASEKDRRISYAVLTPQGWSTFLAAHATHHRGIRQHFSRHCGPEELLVLASLFERLGREEPLGR